MSLPRTLTIRHRLLLAFALTVVLTALAVNTVTSVLQTRHAREQVVAQLKSVETLKKQEIRAWMSGLRLNLDIVLSEPSVPGDLQLLTVTTDTALSHTGAYSRVHDRFVWAASRMGLFEELFFMDSSGSVLISTNTGHEGQRLGLNDYFVEGMKGSFLQQPSYSLSLGEMTIVASAPVHEGGKIVGVIAGLADLTGLNEIMIERAGLGETGETYLVGSNYRLLTYLRRPGYSIPDTYVRTAGTSAAVAGRREGSDTYQGYAGQTVIGVHDWVPELSVALMAEQGEAEALSSSRQALYIGSGVAVLAVVLAILAGIGLTRRIVRPLARLGGTAGRIAGGELDLEADVERQDEIGTLARAFNQMTGRLRDLVRSLERRTDHLRAINETGRHISSILDLDELLPYVANSLVKSFGYESVHVFLLSEGTGGALLVCDGGAECRPRVGVELEQLDSHGSLASVAKTGEALLVRADSPASNAYSEIAVPIRIKQDVVGVLGITARAADLLDDQDLFAASTLADQLAIAIENSRLYEHAHELAASRERQRLARDLHDAVSQTLFSVSLIAEVLPRIYERDPEQGRARLEELRQLTRGALAEMRTLLLELRPAALAEASLPDLLKQLGEAVVGRARIPVSMSTFEDCSSAPSEVRMALYRIAQEALNNVAKHSAATRASMVLTCEGGGIRLVIEDDGAGFDPGAGVGRLGLGIMRERAEAVGATLDIRSQPGQGTTVVVAWMP